MVKVRHKLTEEGGANASLVVDAVGILEKMAKSGPSKYSRKIAERVLKSISSGIQRRREDTKTS